jgi:hypothetical protein
MAQKKQAEEAAPEELPAPTEAQAPSEADYFKDINNDFYKI